MVSASCLMIKVVLSYWPIKSNILILPKCPFIITLNYLIFILFGFSFCDRNVHYIERDGTENYYTMDSTPPTLDKKVKLLSYFRRYMKEHLMKAGASVAVQESDQLSRIPYLHQWHRTQSTVIMQLTNGTLQVKLIFLITFKIYFILPRFANDLIH